MGIFSRFEDKMEDTVEGAASRMSKAPISPVQIAKKAEKQMRREAMVGAGKQYAPTLYTVLVNPDDDNRLFGYYPTLAGETETYLSAKAAENGMAMDGNPLVRFIVDDGLRHGKFDVIAEVVAAPIIDQLREEEMERYGLIEPRVGRRGRVSQPIPPQGHQAAPSGSGKPPLPYVPEEEIDRSIDYGEYTFNSADFEDYRESAPAAEEAPLAYNDAYAAQAAGSAAAPAATPSAAGVFPKPMAGNAPGPQVQPANTVAFTRGGNSAGRSTPDRHLVRARLIDRSNRRPYDLAGARITLGRESGNDIKVADMNASRKHAELSLNAQGLWVIADLGSTNGTKVNGVSVASQPLYPGDIVTIGRTDFEFALV